MELSGSSEVGTSDVTVTTNGSSSVASSPVDTVADPGVAGEPGDAGGVVDAGSTAPHNCPGISTLK
jgi:hypothetical protein